MTVESAVPSQQQGQQQGQPPSPFSHPRMAELLKRAQAAGGVGALLITIIQDLIHPQDPVLCCYYSLDLGAGGAGQEANNFYAIDVVLVTSAYFINIGLFPKSHNFRKRKIHTIADVVVKYDPPTPEELRAVQVGKFSPSNINLTIVFADERGTIVDNWTIESTHPDHVRNLHDIAKISTRAVGFPLAKIGQSGGGGGGASG